MHKENEAKVTLFPTSSGILRTRPSHILSGCCHQIKLMHLEMSEGVDTQHFSGKLYM